MDDLSHLKHITRSPLPLYRIPPDLSVQIISKHSAATICNFAWANFSSSVLVEKVLSRDPNLTLLRKILENNKHQIQDPDDKICLFPLSRYCSSNQSKSLHEWMAAASQSALRCVIQQAADSIMNSGTRPNIDILREVKPLSNLCTSDLSELWEEQRLLGPQQISLGHIPTDLWMKILPKASAVSAARLARTHSTAASIMDKYIKSKQPIKIMEKYSDYLTKRNRPPLSAFGPEESATWYILNMYRSFYRHTLLDMATDDDLWGTRKPEFTEEEKSILDGIKSANTLRKTKEKEQAEKKFRLLGKCRKLRMLYRVGDDVLRE